jgi:flagella basal body P-ring formation protein FlgA
MKGFAIAWLVIRAASGACLAPSGPRILARDLVPARPEFAAADPSLQLAYAPLAGVRKTFSATELSRAAQRAGVPLEQPAELCFEWPLEPLTDERISAALREAAKDESAEVEITDRMNTPVPAGKLEFTIPPGSAAASSSAPLWRGRIQYGSDQDFRIWVHARVKVRRPRVVALEALPARQRIRASQVKVEEALVDVTEESRADTVEQVVDRTPRINVAAGSAVAANGLDTPNDVERGDVVKLRVSDAGATITTDATAEGSGHRGDSIMVRNVSSGKLLKVRIEERGMVTLFSQGGAR